MRMRDYRGIAARFSACAAAKIGARFLLPRYDVIHFSPLYGLRLDSRFQIQQGLLRLTVLKFNGTDGTDATELVVLL